MTPELKAFDTSARTWLSGAEFPHDFGNSIITHIERTVQQTRNLTENELEDYGYREYEKLQHAYRDTLDAKLEAASQMIEAARKENAGLKESPEVERDRRQCIGRGADYRASGMLAQGR